MKKRVLIVKLSAIGDVVMALPMIEATKKKYGDDVEITWVCGKVASPILRYFFDDVKIIEVDENRLLKGSFFAKIFEVIKLWLKIALRKYNLVATAHSDIRYRLLTLPVISKVKRHWGITNGRKHPIPGRYHGTEAVWLITSDDNCSLQEYRLPKLSIQNRHKMFSSNSVTTPSCLWQGTSPLGEALGMDCKDSLLLTCNDESKIIVLVPGGAKNVLSDNPCRRWPLENYVELAKQLIESNNQVILVGSKSDEWVLEAFKNIKVTNLIGKTSLIELLYVLNQADIVVTHDTGTLHLAQLTNTKIIALFGPTNPHELSEVSKFTKIIWKPENLSCCPCYDGRTYAECSHNRCMDKITVKEVFECIKSC